MEPSSKMELFQKLGYAREDVARVLAKLGRDALVNDVLQELIQTGRRPGAPPGGPAPLLVPRGAACGTPGCSVPRGPRAHPEAEAEAAEEEEEERGDPASALRPIVIDGSNVAMSHGNKEVFSCRGIQLAVDWFRERGHTYIKVFVPSWRKEPPRADTPIREQHLLAELERQAVLVCTPSRKVNGKRVVCYDDRYIVKVAYERDGVIVSNDSYRDLQSENPEWKWFIEQRLLMFSFVNDRFMPPDDPLGRRGPTLSNFLSRKPRAPEPSWQHCPYGKKCTYGVKCKFYHPERPPHAQLAVADELRAQTRAWRAAGAGEERPRPRAEQGGPRPGPREPGARGPPPARRAADGAGLEGGLSRLALGEDPGTFGAPRPRRPDWAAPAAPLSLPAPPGLPGPRGQAGPPGRPRAGDRLGDPQSDLLPPARPPAAAAAPAPWPRQQGAARARPGWGAGALWAPPGPAAGDGDARAEPGGLFPPQQVDSVTALCPALSDAARLLLLLQRLWGPGAPAGDP